MSSALASVLFGTPFALLVVQGLVEAEADQLAKKSTIELTLRATSHLATIAVGLTATLVGPERRASAVPTLRQARQVLELEGWQRMEAADSFATPLAELSDWLHASEPLISEAAAQLAASWAVWKQVVVHGLYLFEMDIINFGLIGSLDSAMDRLRATLAKDLVVPITELIAGDNRRVDRLSDVGNLFVADDVARQLTGAAEAKELDAKTDQELADLIEFLTVIDRIDSQISQLWSSISTLNSEAVARRTPSALEAS
jgi:hypothetical protein